VNFAFDLDGQQSFLDFAMEGAVGGQEQVTRQLHGEGGGALHLAAGLDVAIGRAMIRQMLMPQCR